MAKKCVSITLTIDPTEYHGAEDSAKGAVDLVADMLRRDADLPDKVTVNCQSHTVQVNPNTRDES